MLPRCFQKEISMIRHTKSQIEKTVKEQKPDRSPTKRNQRTTKIFKYDSALRKLDIFHDYKFDFENIIIGYINKKNNEPNCPPLQNFYFIFCSQSFRCTDFWFFIAKPIFISSGLYTTKQNIQVLSWPELSCPFLSQQFPTCLIKIIEDYGDNTHRDIIFRLASQTDFFS